jgi:predicted MFS family arabinose efflux permease
VVGALIAASLGDFRHKGALLFGAVAAWAAALGLFMANASTVVPLIALALMGGAQSIVGAAAITLLQTRVPPAMRGRAMSLNTLLIMCVRPMGDFPVGAAIGRFGLQSAGMLSACLIGLVALALAVSNPSARRA